MSGLDSLPSVERLLQSQDAGYLVKKHGRPLTLDAIRLTLEEMRTQLKAQPDTAVPGIEAILIRTEFLSHTVGKFKSPRCNKRHRCDLAYKSGTCPDVRSCCAGDESSSQRLFKS